jgi:hypothetical protein
LLSAARPLSHGDFDADVASVEVPQPPPGERLSEQELNAAVEQFLARLREDECGR